MKDNRDDKDMWKDFLQDGVIKTYDFIPEYDRWVDMETQRNIVKKLENITKSEKKEEDLEK